MSLRRLTLAGTLALALLPVVFLAPALRDGYVLSGATGLFPLDQLQYMALSREAGHLHHVLDHFPMFFLTGLGTRVGLDVRIGFLLWAPVSAVVLVVGFERYVRSLIPPGRSRSAALLLALFYCSPVSAAVWWIAHPAADFSQLLFSTYYFFAAGSVWGYPQIAFAIGLVPICFLAVTSERAPVALAPVAGALVSFLHPWQGLTILVVDALAAARCRSLRNARMAVALIGTGIPLAYYRIVEQSDPRFVLTHANTQVGTAPAWVLLVVLAPLALALVGAVRARFDSPRDVQLVAWPLVAFVAYWFIEASWAPYFLLGLTLPLSVLAVRGALTLWPAIKPGLAAIVVAVLTLPGIVFLADRLHDREVHVAKDAYVLLPSDARALDYVASAPRAGSVLTGRILAPEAWALTGRQAWAASALVSPEYYIGGSEASALLAGRMKASTARHFTRRTRATWLVSGCRRRPVDLRRPLGPLVLQVRHFGCAAVYELSG